MIDQKLKELSYQNPIIIYDGNCILCNRFIKYLIKKDTEERLRYSALQTVYSADHSKDQKYDTVQLLWEGQLYEKAAVIEKLAGQVNFTPIIVLLKLIPMFLKNVVYDLIAKIRFRIFGRSKECMVVLADKAHLFLTKP